MTLFSKKEEFSPKIMVKKPNSMASFKINSIKLDVEDMQKVEGGKGYQPQLPDFSWNSFCGNIVPL